MALDDQGEQKVVRRAGTYSSEDVHHAIFRKPPKPKTIEEMKEGVARYMARLSTAAPGRR